MTTMISPPGPSAAQLDGSGTDLPGEDATDVPFGELLGDQLRNQPGSHARDRRSTPSAASGSAASDDTGRVAGATARHRGAAESESVGDAPGTTQGAPGARDDRSVDMSSLHDPDAASTPQVDTVPATVPISGSNVASDARSAGADPSTSNGDASSRPLPPAASSNDGAAQAAGITGPHAAAGRQHTTAPSTVAPPSVVPESRSEDQAPPPASTVSDLADDVAPATTRMPSGASDPTPTATTGAATPEALARAASAVPPATSRIRDARAALHPASPAPTTVDAATGEHAPATGSSVLGSPPADDTSTVDRAQVEGGSSVAGRGVTGTGSSAAGRAQVEGGSSVAGPGVGGADSSADPADGRAPLAPTASEPEAGASPAIGQQRAPASSTAQSSAGRLPDVDGTLVDGAGTAPDEPAAKIAEAAIDPAADESIDTPSGAERAGPVTVMADRRAPNRGGAIDHGQMATSLQHARDPSMPGASDLLTQLDVRRLAATQHRLGLDVGTDQLGTIRVDAVERSGSLHLSLGAERHSTRQLLASELGDLRSDLGTGDGGVHVDIDDRQRQDPSREPVLESPTGVIRHPSAAGPQQRPPRSPDGHLDVHL